MSVTRRNLIISPIGDESVHASWLSDKARRSFDLMLIYYGDHSGFGRDDATYYVERKGFKWELVDHVLATQGDVIGRYANVWCPDNDIRVETDGVNRLFELFEKYALRLAQPAISAGDVSYETLRQKPGVILRYSPYVEIMCPLFTREALWRVAPTFGDCRSGWGLDWVWPRHFAPYEMAIIDAVGVEHTGRLWRGENYQHLAQLGIHPGEDFARVVTRYGGFDEKLHRKFVRGKIKLPAVRDAAARTGLLDRLAAGLGLRQCVA